MQFDCLLFCCLNNTTFEDVHSTTATAMVTIWSTEKKWDVLQVIHLREIRSQPDTFRCIWNMKLASDEFYLAQLLWHTILCSSLTLQCLGQKCKIYVVLSTPDDGTTRLTPTTPAVPSCCCSKGSASYSSNPPFLIFDIRALWHSVPVSYTHLTLPTILRV